MNKLFVIILLPIISLCASAQEIKISTTVDTKKITLGDIITLTYTVKTNNSTNVILPILPDTFNHFEIIERLPTKETQNGNFTAYTQIYRLTNFDSGQWVIPAFTIKLTNPNTPTTEALTDSVNIEVQNVHVQMDKAIRDIHGPDKKAVTIQQILIICGILIITVLLAYIIYRLLRNKKRKEDPIWKKTLRILRQLEKNKTYASDPKLFCSEVSDILREYLQYHIGLPAKDKSTAELNISFVANPITASHDNVLKHIFNYTDMVKFAKAQLSVQELMAIGTNALNFVEKTYPLMFEKQKNK